MTTSSAVRSSGPRPTEAGWEETVTALEPSAGGGGFRLGGRWIHLAVEPEGWLVGWAPLEGAPDRWFARQPRIRTLAKIVEGPALRVDMPIRGSVGDAFETLRATLRDALAFLADDDRSTAEDAGSSLMGSADRAAGEVLSAYAASAPGLAATDARGFTLIVETARGRPQRIVASLGEGRVRVTAPLGPRPGGPVSRRALTHLLLTLNERLRLARGAVGEAGVVLEVVLPPSEIDVEVLDRAIGALIVAAAMAKRECAALLDPAVAEAYCAFHRAGPSNERAAGTRRVSHQERSVP